MSNVPEGMVEIVYEGDSIRPVIVRLEGDLRISSKDLTLNVNYRVQICDRASWERWQKRLADEA